MFQLIYAVADGILRKYQTEAEFSNYKEHLPTHIILLFQRFKRAYDGKNIKALQNCISDSFNSDCLGVNKLECLNLIGSFFNSFPSGFNPFLTIQVEQISVNNKQHFVAVIEMNVKLKMLNIPLPIHCNQDLLICEAKPEGDLNYWRIIKIQRFKE